MPSRMWHAWNVDRLYMGGVQIRQRAHQGLNHQKSVILYDQNATLPGDQSMAIFGSSNWTSPSAAGQVEHNMFTTKPYITSWFISPVRAQVEQLWAAYSRTSTSCRCRPMRRRTRSGDRRRQHWHDRHGSPGMADPGRTCTTSISAPAPIPPRWSLSTLAESSSKTATSTFSYTVPSPLRPGTTYYWKVVGKTMALQGRSSPVWSFTTAGAPPPPTGLRIVRN